MYTNGVIAYCLGQKINSLIKLHGKNIHNKGNMGSSRNYFVFSQGVSHLFDFTLTKTKQSKTKMQTKKQNKTVGNKQHLSYNFIATLLLYWLLNYMFQLPITTIWQQRIDWHKIKKQSELWNLNALTFWHLSNPQHCFKIRRYTSYMSKSVNYIHYFIM